MFNNRVFISSDFDFVDFCHDSAIHASLMALAAPEVLAPPWARKYFLVGAQISSLKLTLQRYGAAIAVLECRRKKIMLFRLFFEVQTTRVVTSVMCHECH